MNSDSNLILLKKESMEMDNLFLEKTYHTFFISKLAILILKAANLCKLKIFSICNVLVG